MKRKSIHFFSTRELRLIQGCIGKQVLLDGTMLKQDHIGRVYVGVLGCVVDRNGKRWCDLFSRSMLPNLPDDVRLVVRRCAKHALEGGYGNTVKKATLANNLFGYRGRPDSIRSCRVLEDEIQWTQEAGEGLPEIRWDLRIHKGVVFGMASGKTIACSAVDGHCGVLEYRCLTKPMLQRFLTTENISKQYMIYDEQLMNWRRVLRRPETLLKGR